MIVCRRLILDIVEFTIVVTLKPDCGAFLEKLGRDIRSYLVVRKYVEATDLVAELTINLLLLMFVQFGHVEKRVLIIIGVSTLLLEKCTVLFGERRVVLVPILVGFDWAKALLITLL